MAEVAITSRRDRQALVARPITDRARLRDFLEQDRLFSAYALCDLEDREFARTRWGAAWANDELVSVVLEYAGLVAPAALRPRRLRRDRARAGRPHPPAGCVRGGPQRPAAGGGRVVPDRPWSADGPDVGRSSAFPSLPGRGPAAPAGRDRRAEPAVPARLRVVAAGLGDRGRRLLRDQGRRPPCVGGRDPRHQPGRPPGRRRQRPDAGPVSRPGLRDGRDRPRSPPSCCGPATRSSSTSAPTTRPRSRRIAGWDTRSTSASKSG